MNVTGSQVDVLAKVLDAAAMRQHIISQNVANVNTPGYRHLDVNFEDALARALKPNTAAGLAQVQPQVVQARGGTERLDGNNVDIDAEMARLNKNTVLYNTFVQVLTVQLAQMRSAISGH